MKLKKPLKIGEIYLSAKKVKSDIRDIKTAHIIWDKDILEDLTLIEKLGIIEVLNRGQSRIMDNLDLDKHIKWILENKNSDFTNKK